MIKLSDDKLNRTEFLEDLFNLFENFGMYDDGGLTISINGQYGSGKSTILNLIQEKNNIDHKYNILRYDARKNKKWCKNYDYKTLSLQKALFAWQTK